MPKVERLPGPTAFGKYTLLARLATGGMGEVFLARSTADAGFQKLLVIKRLLPHLTDHPQFVNMFLDEARLAAQLHHPNICQIYELGKVGPDHYMAMEYVEGVQLATLLRGRSRSPKLSDPRLTCALLAQACEALHYAHNLRMSDGSLAGVVHRDVNPKNIMVTSAGTVKVLDFGVAKARGKLNLSRTGTLKGTYSYMSPEQLRGEGLDRRSDVFSLGIIAWESVTGRRLFKRPTDVEVWRAIAEKPIPRASALADDVSEELDASIARGLSRDREQRFSTAREFALSLEESLSAYGAPLSTVAIASEVERCFAKELEALRSVVMMAQRINLDDDDDDFDGPTRLFADNKLQERIAALAKLPASERKKVSLEALDTDRSLPSEIPTEIDIENPIVHRARASTSATQVDRPESLAAAARSSRTSSTISSTRPGPGTLGPHISPAAQPSRPANPTGNPAGMDGSTLIGVGANAQPMPFRNNESSNPGAHQAFHGESTGPHSNTGQNHALGSQPPRLSRTTGNHHPFGPPPVTTMPVAPLDYDVSPNRRWPVIFTVIIVALALAVGVHWLLTNSDEETTSSPVQIED